MKLIRITEEAHRDLKSEAAIKGLTMEVLASRIIRKYKDSEMLKRATRNGKEREAVKV